MSREEMMSIIIALIGSGILNVIITGLLYNKKLKNELKSNGNNMLAETIKNSLLDIRDLELKTTVQEILYIEEELKNRGAKVNMFEGEIIYPEIYNNMKTLEKFHDNIKRCREKNEKNVSIKIAQNLVFIDRYIMQSMIFIKENLNIMNMQEWATLFIIDIRKWQERFDKMLVKEINKHNYKLESHEREKWQKERKKEIEKQYDSTILNFLITGKYKKKDKKIMETVKNYVNEMQNASKDIIIV